MSALGKAAVADYLAGELYEIIENQSWFRKNANTVTAIVGFLVTATAYLAATPFASHPYVQLAVMLIGFLGTVFGIKKTKNGFSDSQTETINDLVASYIDKTPLVVKELVDEVDLDALVAEFNKRVE